MWHGWYRLRPGLPWNRVCQGATLEECAKKLTAATKGKKIRCTDFWITGGGYPIEEKVKQ
jgi:hypothetical protein